jgi:hypothetical protein
VNFSLQIRAFAIENGVKCVRKENNLYILKDSFEFKEINIHNTAKVGVATPEVQNLGSREMRDPRNEGKWYAT